ncbi:MAG TPA: 1,4-dihydroxy-2-naphthoate octaprenyltransferase [Candidatus Coprenecus stercoravium]|uniref:1,4-dihydroxy-2-naphthoate octaprenyltransferase n=1 Tax=Candidatus Coprenecus stercoravium TaxID=2840735 RepID=A0A9D2K8M1_9BACT|nr:1,4-dihydroxy-2-naphthoate octaprenyltransferase [Candidatus Coprenecus stercoravium]
MSGAVKINSGKAWVLAARPKTLAGAATPVIMGGACAWMWLSSNGYDAAATFRWLPFGLCMLFAWIMQIDANFVNDWFDFRKGSDTEQRLGPKRACAQGWITPKAMKTGIAATTLLACAAGAPLIWTGGPWMLAVGAACVLFCFLYTTKFSRMGLGDVLVLLFFGIVPVGFTFYLQTGTWTLEATLAGLACGLAVDCLLIVNNYRDRAEDATQGKKTIVVRLGGQWAIILYYLSGLSATLLAGAAVALSKPAWHAAPLLLYAALHLATSRRLSTTDGAALNPFLGKSSRNFFLLSLLFAVCCAA